MTLTPGDAIANRDWSAPVRYPDPAVESLDPRFEAYRLGSAAIERLWTGGRWTEGPVWFGDLRMLIWSDIPNDRMLCWFEATEQVAIFRPQANNSNGNTRDRQGRLVTCEHGTRRVTRTEYDGSITVLLDQYAGKPLNAPNDVVVTSDGAIWFTDPGYGILMHYEGNKAEAELPTRVYRIDPHSGQAKVMIEEMERPNGLCFSPDQRRLYVADSGSPRHVRAFSVGDDWSLHGGEIFADMNPGIADGMRCDRDGNLWIGAGWGGASYDGVHCYAPDGTLIGRIHLPEPCANLCFGGRKQNRLFMTAGQSLYALYVDAVGC
jgi:gluconolactonase